MNIEELQKLCNAGAVRWTGHILKRLMQRGISQSDVIHAVQTGEIIEQYPNDYPYPSCLVLGNAPPLHVVCGEGDGEIWMITAYSPDPEEWENDLKTRKKVEQ